ncbi:MAG TPA: FecR domain-containing protein [Burkholderiales bacterium]
MKPLICCWAFAAAALLAAAQAAAQPAAVIEGVQPPAWIERSEGGAPARRIPISPGMVLQPGDVIHTGAQSRLLVRLSERSLVKLGENGQLRFTELSATREIFRAALGVLEGAFRFTTDLAAKARRREVRVSVASVTAGIRGTDFWGRSRSSDNLQVVCLIEGAIEIEAQGEQPVQLDQPRQFYRRLAGQAQPIGLVEPAQLQQWAEETEIQAGRGAARAGGRFQLVLARAPSQDEALAVYDRLRAAGYPAEIRPLRQEAGVVYLVRIRNLASRADVQALAARLEVKPQ